MIKKFKNNMIRRLSKKVLNGKKSVERFEYKESLLLARIICDENVVYHGVLSCGTTLYYIFNSFVFSIDNESKIIMIIEQQDNGLLSKKNINTYFPYVDVFGQYAIQLRFDTMNVLHLFDHVCGLKEDKHFFLHIFIFENYILFLEPINLFIIGHEYKDIQPSNKVRWLDEFIEKNGINFNKMRIDYDKNRFLKSPLTRFRFWLHNFINKWQ